MKFKRIDLKLIRYKIKSNCKMKINNKKDLKNQAFFAIYIIYLLTLFTVNIKLNAKIGIGDIQADKFR